MLRFPVYRGARDQRNVPRFLNSELQALLLDVLDAGRIATAMPRLDF
jgi:hypothetical protein